MIMRNSTNVRTRSRTAGGASKSEAGEATEADDEALDAITSAKNAELAAAGGKAVFGIENDVDL